MKRKRAPARRPLPGGKACTALALVLAATLLAPPQGLTQERTPEEYRPEEFPPILRDLRRGEIILLGTFPVSLFVTLQAFDLYRFGSNEWSREYAPWPFRSPSSPPYTSRDRLIIFGSALSLSALVAVTDYVVGRIRERRAEDPSPRGR